MESHRIVMPEHLNHYGHLFGGRMLQWVDETAWIAASLDYPGCRLVTIAMDRVEFRKSVKQGDVIRIHVERARVGTTSVQYSVVSYREDTQTGTQEPVFSTHITFVCVNQDGSKTSLPGKAHSTPSVTS